jgi:antirestriction protein
MINLEDYKMTNSSGVGVYVGTYKKYNEGSLFGMWIDLEAVSDAEEFFEVCRELHKDEEDPEFMFQDYQGFPEELYHESMSEDDVEKILAFVALDDDDREMLEAFCECYGGDATDADNIEDVRERCMGQFDTFQDFADQCADKELACMNAPEFCTRYFDYEAYARDLKYDYSVSDNGYIFRDR